MKLFPKDTDYAVRVLVYLAMQENHEAAVSSKLSERGYVSTAFLSEELGIPLNFLRRICAVLIKAEFLGTREGIKGGIRLLRFPHTITLRKIIELFHGKPELSECTFRKQLCPNRKKCVLRRRILGIEEKLLAEFEAITIQTLVDDIRAEK